MVCPSHSADVGLPGGADVDWASGTSEVIGFVVLSGVDEWSAALWSGMSLLRLLKVIETSAGRGSLACWAECGMWAVTIGSDGVDVGVSVVVSVTALDLTIELASVSSDVVLCAPECGELGLSGYAVSGFDLAVVSVDVNCVSGSVSLFDETEHSVVYHGCSKCDLIDVESTTPV